MGATPLGLHPHVEVAAIEVPIQLRPDLRDVAVIAGGFVHAARLLVDQPGAGPLTGPEAALAGQGFAADQFLQQRLPFPHRHHGAPRQLPAQLLIKHTHGPAPEHRQGLGLVAAGPAQAAAHQAQVAPQLAVKGAHQAQPAEGTTQAPQRIAGIEHLKGVLQRIAAAPVHRGIDLDVPPGEHQQGGAESIDPLQQHRLHIQQRHGGQIKDLLRQGGELLVQVIGQVHRANREDRVARQPHQQHPLITGGGLCQTACQGKSGR